MVVDQFGDPGGICPERSLSHIDESVLAQRRSSHECSADSVVIVRQDLGTDAGRIERRTGEPPLAGGQNDAAGRRHCGYRVAVGHDETGSGILRRDLRQQEKVIRELQQPKVGRPVGVEKTEEALVVGQAISVINASPPPRKGRNGEHHLAVVEGHLKESSVFNRPIHPPDVLGIGLVDVLAATGVGVFGGEIRRRNRCFDFPLAKIAKPRVEREHVVQRCGPRAGQTEDYEWARDGISGVGCVMGVPILDAEAPAETVDEKRLDPVDRFAVLTNILHDGLDQAAQAVVPVTRSEIDQPGLCGGTLDELVDGDAHGAPFCPARNGLGMP